LLVFTKKNKAITNKKLGCSGNNFDHSYFSGVVELGIGADFANISERKSSLVQ
jgi:hypothetical protein